MKLIVGLGNPGRLYENTRHNIGARTVKYIAKKYNTRLRLQGSLKSRIASISIEGQECILAIPHVFMNVSGETVALILKAKKLNPKEILIIHDDMDLEIGKLRLRKRGGAGGHKGVNSIIRSLHTNEFNRLKLGIGKAPLRACVNEYVLSPFSKKDTILSNTLIKTAAQACSVWVQEGIERAMNQFN